MAFTSVGKNMAKNGNPGRPNVKSTHIVLFRTDDLLTRPVKDIDGVRVLNNLVLKEGMVAIAIYATPSTIKLGDKSSGDPDKKGFITTLDFEYPGSSVDYSAFINDNINENLMAIVVYPDLAYDKLLGWPGNPLQLNHEQKDDEKEDTNIVKLESVMAGDKYLLYWGELPPIEVETSQSDPGDLDIPYIVTNIYQILATESGEIISY
jgi:hypothetical protein